MFWSFRNLLCGDDVSVAFVDALQAQAFFCCPIDFSVFGGGLEVDVAEVGVHRVKKVLRLGVVCATGLWLFTY